MKKYVIIVILIAAGSLAKAQLKDNKDYYLFSYFKDNGQDGLHLAYSEDGLKWTALKNDSSFLKPTVSNDKLMRDPCIIRGADGIFHMVWTDSWTDKAIGYASSTDLIHWSEQRPIPVMMNNLKARNSWAPEITYDAKTKGYMIYWATSVDGLFPVTDSLAESKYNHRIYYILTKDFKTFTPAKMLFDFGFSSIDATIVPYGKQFMMVFKDESLHPVQKNIKVSFAKNITGPYSKPIGPITGKYWAEGPTTVNINGKWIIYFDKYTEHKYGALSSADLKSWTDISDEISFPKGTRHGTVLKITAAELAELKKQ